MDENQLLQDLVAQAQAHPDRSAQRRIASNKLIVKIRQSSSLKKTFNSFNIPNYQDIYDEALNDVCMEICRRIDSYKPEHPVMAWVNKILKYRIQDVYNKYQKGGITNKPDDQKLIWWEIDKPQTFSNNDSQSHEERVLPPSAIEDNKIFRQQQTKTIRDFIMEDPDECLAKKHIDGIPNATFKAICLMHLDGHTWHEIASDLGSPYQTVITFYKRRRKDLLDYLQRVLGDLLDDE
jgi:DNA-directed RNA polymerase specialized sigma24 family protein